MYQRVVVECLDHEEGKVHAARAIALENRIADVSAPYRQALALALLEVAGAYDGPARLTCEHAPGRFHLVVEVGKASEAREPADDLDEHLISMSRRPGRP